MNSSQRLAMRLLMVGFDGTILPKHVERWIDQGLGGGILFRRNIESLEQLIDLNGAIVTGQGEWLSQPCEPADCFLKVFWRPYLGKENQPRCFRK